MTTDEPTSRTQALPALDQRQLDELDELDATIIDLVSSSERRATTPLSGRAGLLGAVHAAMTGRPGMGGDRRRDQGTASLIPACRGRVDLRPICGPRGCGNLRSFHRSTRCGDESSSHKPIRNGARRSHHHPGTSHQRTRVVAAARIQR